jgi:hypothetical protein
LLVCSGGEFQIFLACRRLHPAGTISVLLVCSCIKIFCGSSLALQGGVVDLRKKIPEGKQSAAKAGFLDVLCK